MPALHEDAARARFRTIPEPKVTDHGRGLAQRCVAEHATDADDCLRLLRMLGLDENQPHPGKDH